MRSTLLGLGTFTALLILAPALPANERTPQAQAISASARSAAATVDAFHAALRGGDTRAAAAVLAEDALIFEAGGAEHSKAEYTEHHLPADAEFSRAVSSVVSRRAGHSD